MTVPYSLIDFLLYLFFYSFLGWAIEVAVIAVKDRHFVNRGFLNLPFALPYGITAVLLLMTLPTLNHNYVFQYILTFIVFRTVWSLSAQFVKGICHQKEITNFKAEELSSKDSILFMLLVSGIYLVFYLIVHPVLFSIVALLPDLLIKILVITCAVLVLMDFFSVLHALRTNTLSRSAKARKMGTQNLGNRMAALIWKRLQKAYPDLHKKDDLQTSCTFASGICFDKLVWVFLISAFLGALIEMVYCRAAGDSWMNRSSLLYGTFSVVWGLGAVVLTVTLQRFAGKEDRCVFLAGFIVGGTYEYICSVFTEMVFGTVFWDYSDMPLNIGGRTNVLYCIFWGILAVVWIKILYPPMEKAIEKLPPLPGKILTWIIVFVLACDCLLTAGAMARYTNRQTQPEAQNIIDEFLDSNYDDDWMENRWPNMSLSQEHVQ